MERELDYTSLIKAKMTRTADREEKYKVDSRDRLKKISVTKVKTTMIGALSAIEKHLGFLWGLDEDGNEPRTLSPEEQQLKDVYEELRSEILDIGNQQIRNLSTELEQYEVSWNRYHMTLPVIPEGPRGLRNE